MTAERLHLFRKCCISFPFVNFTSCNMRGFTLMGSFPCHVTDSLLPLLLTLSGMAAPPPGPAHHPSSSVPSLTALLASQLPPLCCPFFKQLY